MSRWAVAAVATGLAACTFPQPEPIQTATPPQSTQRVLPPCLTVKTSLHGDLAFTVQKSLTETVTMVIDLRTSQIERVGAAPVALSGWSPSGEQLLLDNCHSPLAEDFSMPTLAFWAPPNALPGSFDWLALPTIDGSLHLYPYPTGKRRRLLPRGSLGPGGQGNVLMAGNGKIAWSLSLSQLDQLGTKEQSLHVRSSWQDPEVTEIDLSDDISKLYYRIIDWVPGTSMILAGRGTLGLESWVGGVPMVVIDTITGEIRDLEISMLLTPEAYAWHPSATGWVAIATGDSPFLSETGRLILLDPGSGEMTYLTPLDLAAFEPSWSPDGSMLAYAAIEAKAAGEAKSMENEDLLHGRSIFVLDVESGESVEVTDPGDAIDGWPQWGPDGRKLIYTRQHHGQTEVRQFRLEDNKDEIVVAGLPDPTCYFAGCSWRQMLSWSPGLPTELPKYLQMAKLNRPAEIIGMTDRAAPSAPGSLTRKGLKYRPT